MAECLEETTARYLKRYGTILHPSSVDEKRLAQQTMTQYLCRHHPEVSSWSELRRRPHIEGWLEYLHGLPLKPITRRMRICSLRLFFSDLVAWQWPEAPPPGLIREDDLPPREYHLPRPLPPEVDQAVQHALSAAQTLPAMGLRLLRATGMRISEMIDLHVEALDQRDGDGGALRVPMGKTRKERIVPVAAETVALIHEVEAQRGCKLGPESLPASVAGYLMVDHIGRRISRFQYWRALKRLTRDIPGSEQVHPHRLRHTFATEMARAGMSVQALMRILGHENPAMTMRYVELANADLRRYYEHAMAQLNVLKNLKLPELSSSQRVPANLAEMMDLLIMSLESARRDSSAPAKTREMQRFVKRMRRARDDFATLLGTAA